MSPEPLTVEAFRRHVELDFHGLLNTRVVIALSGGADSTALTALMAALRPALTPVAVHVHHGVRGADADADAAFAAALCERLDVPFDVVRLDPPRRAPDGREATWRRLRYTALEERREAHDASAVATGHHRDDVAEGVLVQLLRGAGPRALAGIATHGPGAVVRPLLPWDRASIEAWLRDRGCGWREDASNRDPGHLRNRVRHEVLPILETVSPAVRGHLVHLAEAIARDQRHLDRELAGMDAWIDPWHPDGGVPLDVIRRLSAALRVRWLHAQVARAGLGRATRRQAELLDRLLDRDRPRAVTLAGRWRLRTAGGRLWLEPPQVATPHEPLSTSVEPDMPMIPLWLPGWRVQAVSAGGTEADDPWRRPVGVGRRLEVRPVTAEDRAGTHGPSARRLIGRSIPRHLRDAWPVICEDGKLTWIPGVWQALPGDDERRVVVEMNRP